MTSTIKKLEEAEVKANQLFNETDTRNLIVAEIWEGNKP